MSDTEPHEHVDLRGDPPVIADLEKLRGIASFRLGNAVYVHATEQVDTDIYAAYLGVSIPTDTSAAAGRAEITFRNYAPVGAMYARRLTIDGETYYEVDLPDRDDLSAAIRAREDYEDEHRAAVIPAVLNELEEWAEDHADRDDDLHWGMALGLEAARREVRTRLEAAYRGDRRWSREQLVEVVDLE
ncbi:hypothetical protein [Natrinema thermotolerans]